MTERPTQDTPVAAADDPQNAPRPEDAACPTGQAGNLFANLPDARAAEVFEPLLLRPGLRIERIVSLGQATPAGEWYDSPEDEWVVLLSGAAGLRLESEPHARSLRPGDWIWLPAGCRHRVEWTDAGERCVWLAVYGVAGTCPDKMSSKAGIETAMSVSSFVPEKQ